MGGGTCMCINTPLYHISLLSIVSPLLSPSQYLPNQFSLHDTPRPDTPAALTLQFHVPFPITSYRYPPLNLLLSVPLNAITHNSSSHPHHSSLPFPLYLPNHRLCSPVIYIPHFPLLFPSYFIFHHASIYSFLPSYSYHNFM